MPVRSLLTLLLVLMLALNLNPTQRVTAAQPARGNGDIHKDDPCTHLPDPSGKAKGIDKQCPEGGSSSGVVKGDFNNDGFADLAIGEPNATISGKAGAGDVIVLYGSPSGLTTSGKQLWYEGPDRNLPGTPEAGDAFGTALASGDFNADGFSDLAIGIPNKTQIFASCFVLCSSQHPESGGVVVIYGSPNGLTSTDHNFPAPSQLSLATLNDSTLVPDYAHFGQSLAWGNFNGDLFNGIPIGDLAIGVPDAQFRGNVFVPAPLDGAPSAGAVVVVAGNARFGFDIDASLQIVLLVESSATQTAQFSNARFGIAMTAGDFDGNGMDDLAVGAPGRSIGSFSGTTCSGTCAMAAGVVNIFSAPFSSRFADKILSANNTGLTGGAHSNDRFGTALAAGDFDGNGELDLAIGVPGRDVTAGTAVVLYGLPGSGLNAGGAQSWDETSAGGGDSSNDRFGTALAAGDFNGDGLSDLAVGVPGKTVAGEINAGQVDVIYGAAASGLSTAHAPQRWNQLNAFTKAAGGPSNGNRFGSSLTAWNFGRNESVFVLGHPIPKTTADLAIGLPLQSVNGISGAGAVDVMYGSFQSNGLTGLDAKGLTTNTFFNGDNIGFGSLAGAHFGSALY